MKIWKSLAEANNELAAQLAGGCAVTIGNFDGVHRGHQAIIGRTVQLAGIIAGQAVVISFTRHTEEFLGQRPQLLNQPGIRRELLAKLDFDVLLEIEFNQQFAAMSPEVFFQTWLVKGLKANAVVVGYDFRFGLNGCGDYQLLKNLSTAKGIICERIPAVTEEGEIISSSKIRQHIAVGNIEIANKMLGYPFQIEGNVVKGEQRGRNLGFPTANIHLGPEYLLPAYGVYLVDFEVEGKIYKGVANVGVKPTFGIFAPLIETHLLDSCIDLYHKKARVKFLRFIRPETRFPDSEALKKQMILDIQTCRKYSDL